jgi:hypothetical protein
VYPAGRPPARSDRVLQIQEDLVGGQAPGLVDEPLAAGRHRQAGALWPLLGLHLPASRMAWHAERVSDIPPALIAEATKRARVIWLTIGPGRPRPAWHIWRTAASPDSPGAAYLLTGPGEQPLPGLAEADLVTVTVPAGRSGGPSVSWTAGVTRVLPGSAEWDDVIGPLVAGRLNAVLTDGQTSPAARWARSGAVYRLAPVDH